MSHPADGGPESQGGKVTIPGTQDQNLGAPFALSVQSILGIEGGPGSAPSPKVVQNPHKWPLTDSPDPPLPCFRYLWDGQIPPDPPSPGDTPSGLLLPWASRLVPGQGPRQAAWPGSWRERLPKMPGMQHCRVLPAPLPPPLVENRIFPVQGNPRPVPLWESRGASAGHGSCPGLCAQRGLLGVGAVCATPAPHRV